ncbi:MAG: heavy metal translocating P-type ATPase [Caldilineaceae bacterium]|nr:heavy metal translocating P-type ATPase [Caldilineaceae bacterium]
MPVITTTIAAGVTFIGGAKLYNRRNQEKAATLCQALQQQPTNALEQSPAPLATLRQQGRQLQASLSASLANLEEEYNWFVKTRIDPLFQGKRHALLRELQLEDDEAFEITPYERSMNRQLAMGGAITALAVATAPLSMPIHFLAVVPLAVYVMRDIYRRAYMQLTQERRLTFTTLVAVNQTLIWLGGFYTLGGVILILSTMGQKISYINEVRSRTQMVNIFGKLPHHVWILQNGVEIEIPFDQLQAGDVLIIHAGQMIPIDGVIIDGYASIDQHRLTGESQPAEKAVGDDVLASTVVLAGRIQIRVEKTGEATVAAQIGDMLEKTASYQMAITSKAAQMADRSVAPTLAVAGLAGLLIGPAGAVAITSTMFGLNLWISGPLALRNFLTVATRRSILIKDGRSLDLLTEIDTVVFDKTGTLTLDQPHVTHIHTFADLTAQDVLRYAAAAEHRQTHPIARAILAHAEDAQINLPAIDETRYEMGYGLQAEIEGKTIRVGSDRFMTLKEIPLSPEVARLQESSHTLGHSLVMVAMDDQLIGAVELEPTLRPEAKDVIEQLRQRNLDFYIISGDQEGPTQALAQKLGIDNYFANTLPENKAKLVEQLQQEGRAVCFVGDGINDSIALKKANVSISLRGSTTVAMDTAQIVLMDTTLEQLPLLFDLAHEMDSNLKLTHALAVIPGAGIWASVFLFHLGILGATLVFEASLWAGIANAMRPLLKYRENDADAAAATLD